MRRTVALLALAGMACAGNPAGPPEALTGLPRALTADETQVSMRSNAFAFELFRRSAAARDSNAFVSPLSVSMALGMVMNGAANATLDSMRATLGFAGMPLADINAGYRGLIGLLRGLDRTTEMRVANSVWFRKGMQADPDFSESLRADFDAAVRPLDFTLPTAPDSMNRWVRTATAGRIEDIIDHISPQDVMFLMNALYFKGRWRQAFDRADTRPRPFEAAFGGAQSVPMMSHKMNARYLWRPQYSAVDLGYGNDAFTMTLVLPALGVDVHAVIDSLSSARWSELTDAMNEGEIVVTIPRFTLEYGRDLKNDLTAMGMGVAFEDGAADFRNLFTPNQPGPFISFVQHKTFVSVNEEGTEAAAVTAVGVGVTSGPPSFTADRPFLLVIRERFSGTVLFVGKILRVPE